MNKIHFDNLGFRKDKIQFFFLILAYIFVILDFTELWTFENPKIAKFIYAAFYLYLAFIFSKIFWYKNFVKWNKKGIMIKLNGIWGKNYKFNDISNFNIQDDTLTISKYNGDKNVFDLKNIELESVNRVEKILKSHL